MKLAAITLLLATMLAQQGVAASQEQRITLKTSDNVTVYGWFRSVGNDAPIVLLFHQADSSHHEYDAIAPHLNAHGYSTLAIDQRSGGSMYGQNLTARQFTSPPSYLSALPDLIAAADWARARSPMVIAWGSSYSASLVFLLATRRPYISAVIAFSPGEYFDDKHVVRTAAAHVHVPIFVDSAADPAEIAEAHAILASSPGVLHVQHVPHAGIHGSSTLLTSRDPDGAAENLNAVMSFLTHLPNLGLTSGGTQ